MKRKNKIKWKEKTDKESSLTKEKDKKEKTKK